LRNLPVTRPNQAWAMDITYIPMARGFVYLAAVVDWFSRRVLSWRLSITLEAAFCIEAVEEALARYGKPDIFNTDQGSQFTSIDFIKTLTDADVKISMDGKGAWRDNVFVERLWRTIKYEEVYLHAYTRVPEARTGIARYLIFYNTRRPHSSLDRKTPDQAYFNMPTLLISLKRRRWRFLLPNAGEVAGRFRPFNPHKSLVDDTNLHQNDLSRPTHHRSYRD
jgi:putative transposase